MKKLADRPRFEQGDFSEFTCEERKCQNSFGATLRNDFAVIFPFTSDSTYTIDSCKIS